jgi:hypothetical protein
LLGVTALSPPADFLTITVIDNILRLRVGLFQQFRLDP